MDLSPESYCIQNDRFLCKVTVLAVTPQPRFVFNFRKPVVSQRQRKGALFPNQQYELEKSCLHQQCVTLWLYKLIQKC